MSATTVDRLAAAADKAMRLLHETAEHDIACDAEECELDGCREVNLALAQYTRDRERGVAS